MSNWISSFVQNTIILYCRVEYKERGGVRVRIRMKRLCMIKDGTSFAMPLVLNSLRRMEDPMIRTEYVHYIS